MEKCPVCQSPATITSIGGGPYAVNCSRCGSFKISDTAKILFNGKLSAEEIAKASGYIRETPQIYIKHDDLEFLKNIAAPDVNEKALKLLRYLVEQHPFPGQQFQINSWSIPTLTQLAEDEKIAYEHLRWLAVTWANDSNEFEYIFRRVLQENFGFIEAGDTEGWFRVSPEGWQFLSTLSKRSELEDTAFIAMSFSETLLPLWQKGIYPGVLNAGYKPLRVDRHEHNNRIDDEIISLIRSCKFIVADFTYQSHGVYFEAGLALGLGKPVVWVCEKQEVHDKKVHFDTRQYSFVRWTPEAFDQLQKDLQFRIEATIGREPVRGK